MLIQKLDIKSTYIPKSERLNKSNSTPSIFSTNNINNIKNSIRLPFLSNDTKIKNDSVQLSYLNAYDMRNFLYNNSNFSTDLMVKYEPKRLLASKKRRNKNNTNTFMDLRNMPLNENKVFRSLSTNKDNNIFSTNIIQISDKKGDEFFDEDVFRLKNFDFRYKSLVKIEENIKEFNSMKKNRNLISQIKINTYDEIINKLTKSMYSQKNIFDRGLAKLESNNENNNTNKDFNDFIKKKFQHFVIIII